MLQQTTVATVKGYFDRFISKWPTVASLASAPRDEVLKEWAGLGYYARARNLHKCAQTVADEFGGKFPETAVQLKALPGVGDYTAAAVAAIAFNEQAAVVDGNIERIISRCHRVKTPLPKAKKEITALVAEVTPADRPGDFAQAMMDLGASLCSPKNPSCLLCPVQPHCEGARAGDMTNYPIKAPKKIKPTRRAVSFWLEHDGDILLERRPDSGLLGGMPGFFSTPWVERDSVPPADEYIDLAPANTDWMPVDGIAKHTFTHFHLETILVKAQSEQRINVENGFWHPIHDLENIGLPTVFTKIATLAF